MIWNHLWPEKERGLWLGVMRLQRVASTETDSWEAASVRQPFNWEEQNLFKFLEVSRDYQGRCRLLIGARVLGTPHLHKEELQVLLDMIL